MFRFDKEQLEWSEILKVEVGCQYEMHEYVVPQIFSVDVRLLRSLM